MPECPTIDRSVAKPIVETIADVTGNVDVLLENSGLSSQWTNPSIQALSEDRVWQLFECASRKHACSEIGLVAGRRLTVSDLGPFGIQLQNSLTLYQCLSHYIRTVSRYSSHARFWLEQEGNALWFCRQGIDLISCGRDQVEQFTIQVMIRIVQLATGSDWMPSRIHIQADSDQAFRGSPLFDATEIESGRHVTGILIRTAPGFECIDAGNADSDFVKQIRQKIVQGSRAFQLDVDAVASDMNISRRTLQRKLAVYDAEWSRLVEQCRFQTAIQQLKETDIPLIELTQALGYTDQANFGRAFRKWTGMSPGTYRRSHHSRDH